MFRARACTCVRGGTTNSTGCGWMGAFHFRVSTFCCLLILPFVLVLVFLDVPLCFLRWVVFSLLVWCVLFRCASCLVGVVPSCTRHGCTQGLRIGGWGGWMIASVSTHLRLCFGFLFFCVCFFRCPVLPPLLRNWSIRRQVISLALCVRTSRITASETTGCAYLSRAETCPQTARSIR